MRKIVRSHAVNELYGAQVFDEPAIALAPTPYAKWLTCRVAMEEYGHHVRFRELGDEIGIPEESMTPEGRKQPLSIFEFPLQTWEEFCVIKLLADLAEILQVEDLLHCSFHPLRNLARFTMPEEKISRAVRPRFLTELVRTTRGRARCRRRSIGIFPLSARFFRARTHEQRALPQIRLKQRTNHEMREDFIQRATEVAGKYGLTLPEVRQAA